MSQITYTVAIILSAGAAILFMRTVFTRRTRNSQSGSALGFSSGPSVSERPTVNNWRPLRHARSDDSDAIRDDDRLNIGIARPPTAATASRRHRGGDLDPDGGEQLPKYEAAPPEYETLYKDGPPPSIGLATNPGGPSTPDLGGPSNLGGSPTSNLADPPNSHTIGQPSRNNDVVINVGSATPTPVSPPPRALRPMVSWSRLLRR